MNITWNNIANKGFTFIENQLIDSMSDVSKRVVAAALIALSCITVIYLASRYYFGNSESKVDKTVDPIFAEKEETGVGAIQDNWLDDPKLEMARIKNANIFPDSLQPSVMNTISYNQKFVVMGRVLELKEFYRKTHYVFTHGQAPQISILNKVWKECMRVFHPHLYHPFMADFRLPHTITYSKNANDFIKTYQANQSTFIDDGHHSDKMISVDAQFSNTEGCESAQYFFSHANNISFTSEEAIKKIFKSNFLNYLPNDTICDMLAKKATTLAVQRKKETQVGVLYAICIPKATIQDDETNFAYPCHPFGRTCRCPTLRGKVQLLEAMQGDSRTRCWNGHLTQYRILTSRLMEEKEVRSFAVDALPKSKSKFYQNQIEALVKELNLYSHLSDLIDQLDELDPDPMVLQQIESLREASPELEEKYVQLLFEAKQVV